MSFKWFKPWTWFESEERNELEQLKRRLDDFEKNIKNTREEPKIGSPYTNLFFSPPSLLTVALASGEVIMRNDSSTEEYLKIKEAKTETEIRDILLKKVSPLPYDLRGQVDYKEEKAEDDWEDDEYLEPSEEVKEKMNYAADILLEDSDFTKKEEDYYLKDVALPIPTLILGSFIELKERQKLKQGEDTHAKIHALKMFWTWLALNPITNARLDSLRFIKKNNITIDENGLLVMYRRVVALQHKTDTEFNDFVTSNYLKVKKNKKSPKNYYVILEEDKYKLVKGNIAAGAILTGESLGSLAELYEKIKSSDSNIYTDNHTKTKEIRIGHVYKEDEDKINLDNSIDCGSGLHVGSVNFGFSGFGNTGVIALVNPMKIRSVPKSDTNKMRVSEMFIAGVYDLKDYKEDVEEAKLLSLSTEYCNTSLEELNEIIKGKDLAPLSCKKNKVELKVSEAKVITSSLKNRIKSFA